MVELIDHPVPSDEARMATSGPHHIVRWGVQVPGAVHSHAALADVYDYHREVPDLLIIPHEQRRGVHHSDHSAAVPARTSSSKVVVCFAAGRCTKEVPSLAADVFTNESRGQRA